MKRENHFLFFVILILSFGLLFDFLYFFILKVLHYEQYLLWGFLPDDIFRGLIFLIFPIAITSLFKSSSFEKIKYLIFTAYAFPLFSDCAFSILKGNLHTITSWFIVFPIQAYLYCFIAFIYFTFSLTLFWVKKWHTLVLYLIPLVMYIEHGFSFFMPRELSNLPWYLLVNISCTILLVVWSILLKIKHSNQSVEQNMA
ncbi:MAG: hypothetical protein HWN65_20650 [Candidatus Helarchaeota archaeon]|nr:hypothetical protein [Candidatus Helarchaeota archaeon]